MKQTFLLSEFLTRFPNDDVCLEEIKKLRFRDGTYCITCKKKTQHYKIKNRTAYSCEFCRHQIFPLQGTIFQKSSTSLSIWFYAMFLLTHMGSSLSIRQLQKELGVTYKTAWRIYVSIKRLMEQNDSDLWMLASGVDEEKESGQEKSWVQRWVFFNKLEIKVVEKEKSTR